MVLLTLSAGAQRWVPMPRWSAILGRTGAVPDSWKGQPITRLRHRSASMAEARVAHAVHRAAAMLPWEPRCLAEATTAQVLLRQLGQPGVVVIGLRPPDGGDRDRGDRDRNRDRDRDRTWDAHAWLLGRHGAITGGRAARGFTATTVFEVPGGLQATEVDLAAPA